MTEPTELLVDDACIDFVHWLTSITLEGRALWELQTDGLISYLPSSAFAQFITDRSALGQSWRLFSVHDSKGELLRATPPTSGVATSPLAAAVEALLLTIIWAGIAPHPPTSDAANRPLNEASCDCALGLEYISAFCAPIE